MYFLSLSLLNPNSLSKVILNGFLLQLLSFLNSILLLNQINQIIVIATGCNSCDYIYDYYLSANPGIENRKLPALCSELLKKLEDFVTRDEQLNKQQSVSTTHYHIFAAIRLLVHGSLLYPNPNPNPYNDAAFVNSVCIN